MVTVELTDEQLALASAPLTVPRRTYLSGPAGCGKTTAAVARLNHLLCSGVRGDQILVWVPQRSLGVPYMLATNSPSSPPGARVDVLSLDGLARRALELFWPLVAGPAGFGRPSDPPTFLTLETAQYYADAIVEPIISRGAFGDVTVPRHRLVSQILDNLNKSALVGFSYLDVGRRLSGAWSGSSGRLPVLAAVQEAVSSFRALCLDRNLLDYSLQVDTFVRFVWANEVCRKHLLARYRYLIADNVEEDTGTAHDLLRVWLDAAELALVVCDEDAGYRTYLGADPAGAESLATLCDARRTFARSLVTSEGVDALVSSWQRCGGGQTALPRDASARETLGQAVSYPRTRYFTQAVAAVVDEVVRSVKQQRTKPSEIAILAPFVDDVLRFALTRELTRLGVLVRMHRPSRALREEPAVRCLMTLALLAHPHWGVCPEMADVAQAFTIALAGLDWTRASRLAAITFKCRNGRPELLDFGLLRPDVQERITYDAGRRHGVLAHWLQEYHRRPTLFLDVFFGQLFEEVLSRPGFGMYRKLDAAVAAVNIIESALRFRLALGSCDPDEVGIKYHDTVVSGVVAAQYQLTGSVLDDAVMVTPVHTFLTENRPVNYQFWLGADALTWGRRLNQPLTHPYVLSRNWPDGRTWSEEDEVRASADNLRRLVLGLLRRCRTRVYLVSSELNVRGQEERGPLLSWIQRLARELQEN